MSEHNIIYTPTITDIKEGDNENKATFVIKPLMSGYGMTLGNSLRRVLLSTISGAAVVSFRVEGATHEYAIVPGLKEDLVQVMLNVKGLRFKILDPKLNEQIDAGQPIEPIKINLNKKGAGPVLGKDIQINPYVEVVNPQHLIATLDKASDEINLELLVVCGRGYLTIEDSEALYGHNDFISLDALFSPVLRVRYKLSDTRVRQITNLDQLDLTIETDGTISPKTAFEEAAAILKEHYTALSGATDITAQTFLQAQEVVEPAQTDSLPEDERLGYHLEDLQLSARTTNALANSNLHTVKDVLNLSDAELRDLKGFGTIALKEIKQKMRDLGF